MTPSFSFSAAGVSFVFASFSSQFLVCLAPLKLNERHWHLLKHISAHSFQIETFKVSKTYPSRKEFCLVSVVIEMNIFSHVPLVHWLLAEGMISSSTVLYHKKELWPLVIRIVIWKKYLLTERREIISTGWLLGGGMNSMKRNVQVRFSHTKTNNVVCRCHAVCHQFNRYDSKMTGTFNLRLENLIMIFLPIGRDSIYITMATTPPSISQRN